jgi:hypothetical protein
MYRKPEGRITHARRGLISLIEKREYSGTLIKEWEIPPSMALSAIYETALGTILPSYGVIFALRCHIPPGAWYYEEEEKLPGPVPFNPRYPSWGLKSRKKVLRDPTVALLRIEEVKEQRGLSQFCARHGLKYGDLWGCTIKRKKPDGKTGYHQRPPYRVIRALRDVIPPDLWYIFPDELL